MIPDAWTASDFSSASRFQQQHSTEFPSYRQHSSREYDIFGVHMHTEVDRPPPPPFATEADHGAYFTFSLYAFIQRVEIRLARNCIYVVLIHHHSYPFVFVLQLLNMNSWADLLSHI